MKRGKKNDGILCTARFYTYPVDVVRRSIQLVTHALTSLRGATKCLDIFSDVFPNSVPSHTAIQNWILQYGLSQLKRPIPRRKDWIYILDHTIEFGHQKCLVILGTTLEQLRKTNGSITHEQLRALTIDISQKSNSQRVTDTLNTLIHKTGIPAQIVSDSGSDLKKAVENICDRYPRIRFTYDITHKCALLLKHALQRDILWRRFQEHYSYTKRRCVHSRFAFLSPMKLQDKSRWMNLNTCVDWARKITAFRENMPHNIQALHLEKKRFAASFREVFGWVEGFAEPLHRWSSMLQVISIARDEVKSKGLEADTVKRFRDRVGTLRDRAGTTAAADEIVNQLIDFLTEETLTITAGQKYLGTSDAIESVFARYKNFSARTPMKGVGKTVLTIPAFLSDITPQRVHEALKSCPQKKTARWLNRNVGRSLFAQRAKAFAN